MAASTRWRLSITASNSATYVGMAQLAMASVAAGADLCTGGTPSASSISLGSTDAAKAFDSNPATLWQSSAFSLPAWLEYQFASPVTIVEYRVQADNSGLYPPKDWTFQYWDGSTWQTVDTQTNQVGWTAGLVRTFTLTVATPVRLSQLPIEILRGGQPAPTLRLSQLPIEILRGSLPPPALRLSQLPIEVLRASGVAEVPPAPVRLSQLPVEVLLRLLPVPLRATQLVVETLDVVPNSPLAVTQVAAEILFIGPPPNDARVTQLACELIIIPRPVDESCPVDIGIDDDTGGGYCVASPFPIDPNE